MLALLGADENSLAFFFFSLFPPPRNLGAKDLAFVQRKLTGDCASS